MNEPMSCEIRVRGHLSPHWNEWFGGLTVENEPDGDTFLSGTLPDQAALYGVLGQVRDLGLTLVFLYCVRGDRSECTGRGWKRDA
jgi:hypothetical protein